MPKTSRRAGVKWRVIREKARFKLSGLLPRVDLSDCSVCRLNLQDRRKVAAMHYAGYSNPAIGEAVGIGPVSVWGHTTRCIPQIIEATMRLERQRDCDHIGDLQKLVLETFDLLKVGIQDRLAEGDATTALQIGHEFLDHLDSYSALMDRVDKNRHREASIAIRALCAKIVELDPVRGAEAIDVILGGNPALKTILDDN